MRVIAVVVVGGGCGALDPLTPLAGVPLLVRSVRMLLAVGVVARVLLVGAGEQRDPVVRACAGLPVDVRDGDLRHALSTVRAHARQRASATTGDGSITLGPTDAVLVHDAARPLAPPALAMAALAAVRDGHDIAVPVLPLADTVKQVDGDGVVRATPDRSTLRVVQTPQAFRAAVVVDRGPRAEPLDLACARAAAGVAVHAVAGDPLAFAVRTPWDLELAELLLAGTG